MKHGHIAITAAVAAAAAVAAILAIAIVAAAPPGLQPADAGTGTDLARRSSSRAWPNVHPNVETDFNPQVAGPQVSRSAFIHPFAIVIGDCYIGKMVLVAPTAVCRGDEGTPIHISSYSNIQDGVVIHALETTEDGHNIDGRRFTAGGDRLAANDTRFQEGYAVWVGERTSLAHGVMLHGPAWVGNDTFVGMESLIFNAKVGNDVAVGVASTITGGVVIPDGKYVPPGSVITTQEQADALPPRVGSPYENTNKAVIHVNESLAEKYDAEGLEKLARQREALMEKGMMETSGQGH